LSVFFKTEGYTKIRKSYTGFRLAPNSVTLDDLERQNRGFIDFLPISSYHSRGGTRHMAMADVYIYGSK